MNLSDLIRYLKVLTLVDSKNKNDCLKRHFIELGASRIFSEVQTGLNSSCIPHQTIHIMTYVCEQLDLLHILRKFMACLYICRCTWANCF